MGDALTRNILTAGSAEQVQFIVERWIPQSDVDGHYKPGRWEHVRSGITTPGWTEAFSLEPGEAVKFWRDADNAANAGAEAA